MMQATALKELARGYSGTPRLYLYAFKRGQRRQRHFLPITRGCGALVLLYRRVTLLNIGRRSTRADVARAE